MHAESCLVGFTGRFLQCDGDEAYDRRARRHRTQGGWTLVNCWSHLRRRFVKIAQATRSPVAEQALRHIAALQTTVRGQPPALHLAARRQQAAPIVAAMESWVRAQFAQLWQASKLAEAIRYALGDWQGLTLFLDDGRLELDTNPVENAIRPIALTRKNALFAGHESGPRTGPPWRRSSPPAS